MFAAAAAKRTALAVASIAALLAVAIVGPAGGAPKWAKDKGSYRDRVAPTAPANPHVVKVTPNLVYVAWDPSSDNVGGRRLRRLGRRPPVGRALAVLRAEHARLRRQHAVRRVRVRPLGQPLVANDDDGLDGRLPRHAGAHCTDGLHAGSDDRERGRPQLVAVRRQRRRRELRRVPRPRPGRDHPVAERDPHGSQLRANLHVPLRRGRRHGQPLGPRPRLRPDRGLRRLRAPDPADECLGHLQDGVVARPRLVAVERRHRRRRISRLRRRHADADGDAADREPREPRLQQDVLARRRRVRRRGQPLVRRVGLGHDLGLRGDCTSAPDAGHHSAVRADRARRLQRRARRA